MTPELALSLGWQDLEAHVADVDHTRPAHHVYARMRYHYLRLQSDELESFVRGLASRPEHALVYRLGDLRARVRRQATEIGDVSANADILQLCPDDLWRGEAHMVLAMVAETSGELAPAHAHYRSSKACFRAAGQVTKAIFAEANELAAFSRLYPNRRLIHETHQLKRRALEASCFSVAATALINLSREYQTLGALSLSLANANEALALLATHDFGTYQYYLGVAQRCHVLLDRGEAELAQLDFDEIACSDLVEARTIAGHLRETRPELRPLAVPVACKPTRLPETWSKRVRRAEFAKLRGEYGLSDLEEQLLTLLIDEPRATRELAVLLYGEKIPLAHAEDRVRQLIRRLRTKCARLVRYQAGKYKLA